MAGDWIKIEHWTPDKPEVFQIADQLQIDPDAVTGKLIRIWIWADQQTTDGNAVSVTRSLLDRLAGVTGFAKAMESAGWLTTDDGGIWFTNFDRHNGETAKQRALTAKRVAKTRNAKRNGDVTVPPLPREEKRREEKKEEKGEGPPTPSNCATGEIDSWIPDQPDIAHLHSEERELLERWHKTPGTRPYKNNGQLSTILRSMLRLVLESGYDWRDALAKFPLPAASGWQQKPGLRWFLTDDHVERAIQGDYDFTDAKKQSTPTGPTSKWSFGSNGSSDISEFEDKS